MRCASSNTHLWCISVLGGAILLCVSFFVEPSQRQLISIDNEKAASFARQIVIEYSSVLGGLSNIESAEDEQIEDKTGFVATNDSDVDMSVEYTAEAVDALERLVQCEAATEDTDGRMLVANVVLNRVDTGIWGDDIMSVIEAPGQFRPVANGAYKVVDVDPLTKDAVFSALIGEDISQGAIYFQKSSARSWGDKEYLFRHGSHSFYK